MKKIIAVAVISAMPFAAAYAQQTPDKNHPPQKAMDSATPEMKGADTESQKHGPQKAMDSAVEGSSTGDAQPGAGGTTYNAQDANKAAEDAGGKQKLPPENAETQGKQ